MQDLSERLIRKTCQLEKSIAKGKANIIDGLSEIRKILQRELKKIPKK